MNNNINSQNRYEKANQKKRKKVTEKKQKASIWLLSFVIYFIMVIFISGNVAFDFWLGKTGVSEQRIVISDGKNKSVTLDENILRNGILYLPVSSLSEKCGYTLAGDVKNYSIVFHKNNSEKDEYAKFICGTRTVIINGTPEKLNAPSYFESGELYVPLDFFKNYLKGIEFEVKEGKTVTKNIINIGKDFGFLSYGSIPETSIIESEYFPVVPPKNKKSKPTFTSDLSAYEQYMEPADKDKYLLLVNTDSALAEDYVPEDLYDLINTRKDGRATQQMEHCAEMALEAMFKEAAACGYKSISVTSAYRTYNNQKTLYNNQVQSLRSEYADKAEEKAAQAVAVPGTSEHQSGLCADLHNLSSASQAFADTNEYKWLYENCAKFGFILRYPKNKTDITGIMFEPWHFRFVGRYHATKIMESGLCLEEYIASLASGK